MKRTGLSRRTVLQAGVGACLTDFLPAAQASDSTERDTYTDILIIGGGGAGLAAAARASRLGAKVLLCEKMPAIGGNTRIASGYITGVWPKYQIPHEIRDSVEKYREAITENAGPGADPARIARLADASTATLEWLEAIGLRFHQDVYIVSGEHFPRTYKPLSANGEGLVSTLSAEALRHHARIRTGTAAVQLLRDARTGRVTGAVVEEEGVRETVRARLGVLLAAGGFAANDALVARFAPRFVGLTHNNAPGATGEMLLVAEALGAKLVDTDKIQCQPGCPPGRSYRVRLHNEPNRFILISKSGERFVREDERRDRLRDAVLALPGQLAYAVVDDAGLRSYNRLIQKETVWGVETGDAFTADTVDELARAVGVPEANLRLTIERYNDAVHIQRDRFGKDMTFCSPIAVPPFWACFAGMTRHATEGGIAVTPAGRVLSVDGSVIPGLWAAGEITGGLHGENQMGGNGLADALTFGRLAAEDMIGYSTKG